MTTEWIVNVPGDDWSDPIFGMSRRSEPEAQGRRARLRPLLIGASVVAALGLATLVALEGRRSLEEMKRPDRPPEASKTTGGQQQEREQAKRDRRAVVKVALERLRLEGSLPNHKPAQRSAAAKPAGSAPALTTPTPRSRGPQE